MDALRFLGKYSRRAHGTGCPVSRSHGDGALPAAHRLLLGPKLWPSPLAMPPRTLVKMGLEDTCSTTGGLQFCTPGFVSLTWAKRCTNPGKIFGAKARVPPGQYLLRPPVTRGQEPPGRE